MPLIHIEQEFYSGVSGYYGSWNAVGTAGNMVVVGEWGNDASATNAGKVYLYSRSGSASNFSLFQEIQAPVPTASDYFGRSVALRDLGSGSYELFVGAPGRDNGGSARGSVYVFTSVGGANFTFQQEIQGPAVDNNNFGYSIACDDTWLIIGARGLDSYSGGTVQGSGYFYTKSGGTWGLDQTVQGSAGGYDGFGYSVALDGNSCIFGARVAPPSAKGAAYVFTYNGSTWSEEQKLTASPGGSWNFYGNYVSLRGDVCAVGATHSGAIVGPAGGVVEVWTRSGTTWTSQQEVAPAGLSRDNHLGPCALNTDGSTLYIAADSYGGYGRAWKFTSTDLVTWTETATYYEWSNPIVGANYGTALFLSDDDKTLLIGGDGAYDGGTEGGLTIVVDYLQEDYATVPIGTLYVDYLEYKNPGGDGDIINKIPAAGETDVSKDQPIYFQAVNFQGVAFDGDLTVYVTSAATGVRTLAYDQASGGFQAGWSGTLTIRQSPGSAVNDELVMSLSSDTDYTSLDVISVEVETTPTGYSALSSTYSFTIEDYTAPGISDILWLTPRKCRIKFDEAMDVSTAATSSLFYRYYKGGVVITGTNTVRLPGATLTDVEAGLYLGIAGSAYPGNNGFHLISSINNSTKEVTVSTTTLQVDNGLDHNEAGLVADRRTIHACVSPYVFTARTTAEGASEPNDSAERTQCAYCPIPIKVEAVPASELPTGADTEQYAYVTVLDDISFGRLYTIAGYHAEDKWENAMSGESLDFQTPLFKEPETHLNMWSDGIIPPMDKIEDMANQRELRKMCVVLNDGFNQLRYRSTMVQYIEDPFRCPEHLLDQLLYDLANPFRFPLSTAMLKRKVAWALPELYKRIGTRRGIKDAIFKILGMLVTVQSYLHDDAWILGDTNYGILGSTTILAPDTEFARNCYEIQTPRAITSDEQRIIQDVAQWADPPNMHLVRIVEDIVGGSSYSVTSATGRSNTFTS